MSALSPALCEVIDSGGKAEITVTGNSMYPMLKHRVSRVRMAKAEELRIGDLPLYRRDNGAYILHRIVGKDGDTFVCCGDHQWHPERGIHRDQILAVVTDFCRTDRWQSCTAVSYRLYVRLWMWIRPLRHLLFGGVGRIKRFLLKGKGGKR